MLEAEKKDFINSIFSDQAIFEKNVLDVYSVTDREEIMQILSSQIINTLLKEELNFLYMKDMDNFKFSLIRNILFKEIANEWVSYGEEKLALTQEEALETIQIREHVVFLFGIVKEYYEEYKELFFEVIADSFISLVAYMPNATQSNELIEYILKSPFIKDENVVVMHTYSQLWARVKNAHDRKKKFLTNMQVKVAEEQDRGSKHKYELKERELQEKPLAYFDDATLRLRNTMVTYMKSLKT